MRATACGALARAQLITASVALGTRADRHGARHRFSDVARAHVARVAQFDA
jgi:hypothetical protein